MDREPTASMKLLFICSRNRLRSPTAEAVFAGDAGIEAASAATSVDADVVVSADLVEWAEIIFVMERIHERKLKERFGSLLKAKRVVTLGIPDTYRYMDPGLIAILRRKVTPYLTQHLFSPAADQC